jgi:hypothetical protein
VRPTGASVFLSHPSWVVGLSDRLPGHPPTRIPPLLAQLSGLGRNRVFQFIH